MGDPKVPSSGSGSGPASTGIPENVGEWVLVVIAAMGAFVMGRYVVANPDLFHLELSFTLRAVLGTGAAVAIILAVLFKPVVALTLLVALVYLNLSDVLIRAFDLPSILQLLGLPILISAWIHHGRGAVHRLLGEPLTWFLTGFTLFHLASTTWADQPALADARFEEFFKALALYSLIVLLMRTPARARMAVWTMVGAGALLGILGLILLATGAEDAFAGLARASQGQIYGDVFGLRLAGPLGDPNFFAQILLVLVPFALFLSWDDPSRRGRFCAVLCLFSILAATIMTYSRGGAIALVFVVSASFVAHGFNWRRMAVVGLPLILAAALLVPSGFRERLTTIGHLFPDDAVLVDTDSSVEERMVLMGTAWEMMVANPLLGVGGGNYTARFGEYAERFGSVARDYQDPDASRYAHNLYLEVGAETGCVGLGLFLGALLVAFVSLGRGRELLREAGEGQVSALARAVQISLAGYLISGLFLHGDFERYLWLLLGMAGALHAMGRLGHGTDSEPNHVS